MDYHDFEKGTTQNFFWFKGKTNLLETLLARHVSQKNLKILNIGAGTGDDIEILQKYGSVYAIDIDAKALALIPSDKVIEKKIGDAQNLQYADDFFDIVIACDVLEHIKDDARAVLELKRVLKRNGLIFMTVPAMNFLFGLHDRALGHFRRHTTKSVSVLFKDFRKIKLGYWMSLMFLPAALKRLFAKRKRGAEVDTKPLPQFLNKILYSILLFENRCIDKGFAFPWGLTVFGVFKKQ